MQNFSKKVTRNDVAKLAGTSSAVVSYVINNGPKPVSDKTRKKVLEAIKLTGYQPNNIARALVSGKSRCLGLIIPNISNPFIASSASPTTLMFSNSLIVERKPTLVNL